MTQKEIEEYFRYIQCEECPFMDRCNSLMNDYDAPALCDCVIGKFKQPINNGS